MMQGSGHRCENRWASLDSHLSLIVDCCYVKPLFCWLWGFVLQVSFCCFVSLVLGLCPCVATGNTDSLHTHQNDSYKIFIQVFISINRVIFFALSTSRSLSTKRFILEFLNEILTTEVIYACVLLMRPYN
jgi:hypothetical protein